jgi:hypothetical protein
MERRCFERVLRAPDAPRPLGVVLSDVRAGRRRAVTGAVIHACKSILFPSESGGYRTNTAFAVLRVGK